MMPSLPDMRKAFAKLLRPLMGDEDLVFRRKVAINELLNARHVSDEDTLEYFKRMVDKIHLIDPPKPLLDEIDSSDVFCREFEGLDFSEENNEQKAPYQEEADLQENCEPELQATYDWEGDEAYQEAEAYQEEFAEENWEQGDEAYQRQKPTKRNLQKKTGSKAMKPIKRQKPTKRNLQKKSGSKAMKPIKRQKPTKNFLGKSRRRNIF